MPKKLPTLNLPTADSLFTTQEERDDVSREKVLDIPLSEIDPFPDHPFLGSIIMVAKRVLNFCKR
jgi:ParB family chromosome partitioning protein